MTDERGRKRDTPNGVFGPSGPPVKSAGPAPRGAGLSGHLPTNPRFGNDDKPGSAPISIQNQPRRTIHDPRSQDASRGGPWEGGQTPAQRAVPHESREPREQPLAAPRSPPPPRPPASRVDGFAATRPAEVVGGRSPSMDPGVRGATSRAPSASPGSSRPNERGPAGPARPLENKPSLRLKLEGDTYYEANEGRVKVPKRRGPVFFGFLLVVSMLAVGAFLWIDGHGGIENFVAALSHLGEPSQDPAVQSSVTYVEPNNGQPAASGALAATPGTQPQGTQPPAAMPPATAPQQPATAAKPAEQAAPQPTGQVATGEIEAPDEQPANGAQPANETGVKTEQPAAAKPKPKPVAAKPKPKPAVHRDPVLKVQPLGDVLNAAPPDPGGGPSLPPPDPPAPD